MYTILLPWRANRAQAADRPNRGCVAWPADARAGLVWLGSTTAALRCGPVHVIEAGLAEASAAACSCACLLARTGFAAFQMSILFVYQLVSMALWPLISLVLHPAGVFDSFEAWATRTSAREAEMIRLHSSEFPLVDDAYVDGIMWQNLSQAQDTISFLWVNPFYIFGAVVAISTVQVARRARHHDEPQPRRPQTPALILTSTPNPNQSPPRSPGSSSQHACRRGFFRGTSTCSNGSCSARSSSRRTLPC